MEEEKTVTICGSYRKFDSRLRGDIQAFRDIGYRVLSPKSGLLVVDTGGFVTVKGDLVERLDNVSSGGFGKAVKATEDRHLRCIGESTLVWFMMPLGYIGASTSFEFGVALGLGKDCYCLRKDHESCVEERVKKYMKSVERIEDLKSL